MQVCDRRYRGLGISRDLVRFAEAHMRGQGAEVMRLDRPISETWRHPLKARLEAWYTCIGYKLICNNDFNVRFRRAGALLAGPAAFVL